MKAILVIDKMPNSCNECEVRCTGYTAKDYAEKGIKRPSWCPVKPLPEKKELANYLPFDDYPQQTRFMDYVNGYNACIDEIMGEKE